MKFTVSSSELLSGLMSVSKVIVPKPTNSILENYLFQLQDNTLTVTASVKPRSRPVFPSARWPKKAPRPCRPNS